MVLALEQFLTNIRAFHELYDVPAVCDRELMLRSEMRKTMTDLASALTAAADNEPIACMAALYRGAALKAAQLAENGPCRRPAH